MMTITQDMFHMYGEAPFMCNILCEIDLEKISLERLNNISGTAKSLNAVHITMDINDIAKLHFGVFDASAYEEGVTKELTFMTNAIRVSISQDGVYFEAFGEGWAFETGFISFDDIEEQV